MKELKDHEIAQFVNELTKVGKTYGQTQQLRDRLSDIVHRTLQIGVHKPKTMQIASACVGKKCGCPPGYCAEAGVDPEDTVEVLVPSKQDTLDAVSRIYSLGAQNRQSLDEQLIEIRRRERPSQAVLDMIVGGDSPRKPDDITNCGIASL